MSLEGGLIASPRAQYKNTLIFHGFAGADFGFLTLLQAFLYTVFESDTERERRLDGRGMDVCDVWSECISPELL